MEELLDVKGITYYMLEPGNSIEIECGYKIAEISCKGEGALYVIAYANGRLTELSNLNFTNYFNIDGQGENYITVTNKSESIKRLGVSIR